MSSAGARRAHVLLGRADADLLALETLARHPAVADEIVGFHAQQAVEKLLKAVLAAQDQRAPRTHSVRALFDLIADSGIDVPADLRGSEEFSQFAVQLRYEPLDYGESFDREEVVRRVKAVRDWAAGHMTPRQ